MYVEALDTQRLTLEVLFNTLDCGELEEQEAENLYPDFAELADYVQALVNAQKKPSGKQPKSLRIIKNKEALQDAKEEIRR